MASLSVIPIETTVARRTHPDTVLRATQGDSDAFVAIYRDFYGLVSNYVYRRVGNRHQTEDLVSEVFLRVLKGLPKYQWMHIPFEVWVYRVASNTVSDWVRKEKLRRLLRTTSTDCDRGVCSRGPGTTIEKGLVEQFRPISRKNRRGTEPRLVVYGD